MIGHSLPVYQGYASQYGHGLGNVLGGLVRYAMPVVGKIAKAAGTQLLETGLNYVTKKIRKRKATSRTALQRRYLKTRKVKRSVSHPRVGHKRKTPPGQSVRRSKRKKTSSPRDIFSS